MANTVLLREKEKLEELLDSSPIGAAFVVNNKVVYVNTALQFMTDIKINESIDSIYYNPVEKDKIVTEIYKNKFIKDYEVVIYNGKKELRKVMLSGTFLDFNGENGFLAWFIDVTDIRTYEKKLIKAKEMADAAGVKLGRVVTFSEGYNYSAPMYANYKMAYAMDSAVPEAAPGGRAARPRARRPSPRTGATAAA